MKILSFEIHGLFGREEPIGAALNPDLNIITGRNGAGKTTVLKLLWYIVSGNIQIAIREVEFSRATVITTAYTCTVHRINRVTCKVDMSIGDKHYAFEDADSDDGGFMRDAEDEANDVLRDVGASIFLPTFRRIEGGFTLSNKRAPFSTSIINQRPGPKNDVEEGLHQLSRSLSNNSHVFVASISTGDVVSLLLQKYAEMSERSNSMQRSMSQSVIDQIKSYKGSRLESAESVIDGILAKIESVDADAALVMKPFEEITKLVQRLFKHSGIQIGGRLSIGDAASAINSDALSAGEKQMLSFICYNAFHSHTPIFIDEPELSLHVDWQRQLFPTLFRQETSNQFIIATHSPFIYSKYPDKEVMLANDRGDESDSSRDE